MTRRPVDHLPLFFKGAAMGVADTVPGVSGGTVAFITGIYEELIQSLARIGPERISDFTEHGLRGFWYAINGNFLLAVFSGLLIALFSVAEIMNWLISHHRVLLWAFFFGMIAASVPVVLMRRRQRRPGHWLWLGLGAAFGMAITLLGGGQTPDALWMVFIAGMIAISAMVLPGISGSFLLLVLGQYEVMVRAVVERDLLMICTFALGAVIGLLSIARLLSKLFHRHHDATIALLTGFMVGSLNALWPWQGPTDAGIGPRGHMLPFQFELLTGQPGQAVAAVLCCAAGIALVILFARLDPTARPGR